MKGRSAGGCGLSGGTSPSSERPWRETPRRRTGPLRRLRLLQKPLGPGHDVFDGAGRRVLRAAPRDRLEVGVPQLQRHGPRQELLLREVPGGVSRELRDLPPDLFRVGQIPRERLLAPDRLSLAVGLDRAGRPLRAPSSAAPRRSSRPRAPGLRPRRSRTSTSRWIPSARSLAAVFGPDSPERVHRQTLEEPLDPLRRDDRQAVRLLESPTRSSPGTCSAPRPPRR